MKGAGVDAAPSWPVASRGKPGETAALGRDASLYFFTRVTYVYPRFS